MTPTAAAELLGVMPGASAEQIEAAYKRLARAAHPDRFAGGTPAELQAAGAQFVRLTDARNELLLASSTTPIELPYEGYEARAVPTRNWWAFGLWAVFLFVGLVVSSFDFTAPGSIWDILLRLVPIGICSVAFALTGHRGWLIAMVVLAAASIALTIAIASFGPLIAIELLLIPMLGMAALGRSRRRARPRPRPAPVVE